MNEKIIQRSEATQVAKIGLEKRDRKTESVDVEREQCEESTCQVSFAWS